MKFSKNVSALEPSATLAIAARAKKMRAEGRSVIDLSAGEPSFPTPGVGMRAAVEFVESGRAGYPPTAGTPELRSAVSRYVAATTAHGAIDEGCVLVSAGVKQALFNLSFCLFQEGDEVLIPAPFWPTYLAVVELAGARPVIVPTSSEDGFRLDLDELESRRGPRTRGLFINSPGNPSGATYDLALLTGVCDWCATHDVWLLSDEIYRRLFYEGNSAPSVYDVAARGKKVVHLDGVSKAFSMPGWRIGYACAPPELIAKASALQSQTTSGAAAPSQAAAAAVLSSPDRESIVAEFRDVLNHRRETAVEALRDVPGIDVTAPSGGIYVYAKLVDADESMSVAESLLVEGGVASVPGEAFGTPGFLRLNYAVSDDDLAEGIARIVEFFA